MMTRTQTRSHQTRLLRLCGAAGIALLTAHAGAQDALGDGRALDANPGQYGRGNVQQPGLAEELRFRNAIATGNAPGGLSFRGDVGYRAPSEFTGELGSDSLFAFRRDSLYSGLAGMGIRGTDALQYQFALTTGAAPPRNLMGNLSFSREDQFSTASGLPGRGSLRSDQTIGIDRDQFDMDDRGQALSTRLDSITGMDTGSMMGTLRSSSTYNTTSTLQPSLLSVYAEGEQSRPVGLVASPLLGITPTPLADPRTREPNPLVTRPPNADTDPTVPGGLPSTRVTTAYDDLVQQMRDRVEAMRQKLGEDAPRSIRTDETNDEWLTRQMQDIRNKLYGTPSNGQNGQDDQQQDDADTDPMNDPAANPANNPLDQNNLTDPTRPTSPTRPGTDPDAGTQRGPGSDSLLIEQDPDSPLAKRLAEREKQIEAVNKQFELYDPTEMAIDPDTLEVLRGNAANEIEQLLDPGAESRDLYSEHIVAGQRLIADARYFDAEERFTHALSIRPGDVVAQQGRLHAQIGAGMVLSASVNLQSLYSVHPELITTRFAERVLPGVERVKVLKQVLRERAGLAETALGSRRIEGDRVRVASGLLLAYLGYQTRDEQTIEAGLGVVRELGNDSDRRFGNLLSQLWLDASPEPEPEPETP